MGGTAWRRAPRSHRGMRLSCVTLAIAAAAATLPHWCILSSDTVVARGFAAPGADSATAQRLATKLGRRVAGPEHSPPHPARIASRRSSPGVAPGAPWASLARPAAVAASARTAAASSAATESPTSAIRTYFTGIGWYLMHFLVGITNDGLMKYLGSSLPPFQIVFLRFVAAGAVLLPIMLLQGPEAFRTSRLWMHGARGLLLALGIGLWCFGLTMMPFASCVVINNTMPFFKMLFAKIFLGEKVGKERWIASLGGFVGCLIVFNPTVATFQPQSLVLLLSAMCFASLDIFNKKYAVSESVVSMLFYGSVATALISAVRAIPRWVPVTQSQLGLVALLGVGANLLLFCLLRAFRYVDASATCPYRYTEFVLSAIIGFLVFKEKPMASTLLGSCIILPSVIYCALVETRSYSKEEEASKQADEAASV